MKRLALCAVVFLSCSISARAAENRFAGAFAHPRVNRDNRERVVLENEIAVPAGVPTPAAAQGTNTTHSVTSTWVDTLNPVGTTYSVYRATGLCSGTPVFAKLATGVAALTYKDSTVTPGNYCYQVTATSGGVESSPSNSATATVPSFPPTSLTLTSQ